MSFSDIFKSSFLENFTSVSIFDMLLAMTLSFVLGLFIYFVYKKTYSGVMFQTSFGVTLVSLCMITTLVILGVTSNVVLSLGMVGALSIVRFRAAIKEPLDIAFLFWSIAAGIVLAAGMIPLAVIGSLIIGIFMILFCGRNSGMKPYILVIRCNSAELEAKCAEYVKNHTARMSLKSKTVSAGSVEVDYAVRLKDDNTDFVNKLASVAGVSSCVLVSYNGVYMG
jgi:uncharacterized membrane protein YhiD involved in acid resistance